MSQTVHTDGEQPFVDDLYMKHMAALVSNGQQMEARFKEETRGNVGETNFIKLAQRHLHQQDFQQLHPKVTFTF